MLRQFCVEVLEKQGEFGVNRNSSRICLLHQSVQKHGTIFGAVELRRQDPRDFIPQRREMCPVRGLKRRKALVESAPRNKAVVVREKGTQRLVRAVRRDFRQNLRRLLPAGALHPLFVTVVRFV